MFVIDPKYQKVLASLKLTNWEAVLDRFPLPNRPPKKFRAWIVSGSLPLDGAQSLAVFYKLYDYRPPTWKFLGRRSKARCEFQNYEVFQRLGLPCAERIAFGEQRDALGRLSRAFIITRAITHAITLNDFFKLPNLERQVAPQRAVRIAVLEQLARNTRRLHDHHFFHQDLVWRNILVTWQEPGPPRLWLIDCPRGRFNRGLLRRRRSRLRDLGSLDKSAAVYCSRSERLRLFKIYWGQDRLTPEMKRWTRDILQYRRKHWPG